MGRTREGYRLLLAVMVVHALTWLPTGICASVEDHFASGVAAARTQDHAAAIRYFEAAARAGMRKPLLYYNLGVSYYREGHLDKAEEAFQLAEQSPELAALSYYNLGLIARDQGRNEQAINRFEQAEAAAQTQQMRRLSRFALQQMAGEDKNIEVSTPWRLWAEGGIGYDSNAALAADFVTDTGGRDETFGFYVYGQYDFARLRVHGLVNAEHYSEITDFNFDMLETGVSLPLQKSAWAFRPGLSVRHLRLGGEPIQDSAALSLESIPQTGARLGLKFYLEHETISAGDGYGYLEGTRNFIQASTGTADNRWRLILDAEFNRREDLSAGAGDNTGTEFFSFSPRRQQWQLEYRNPLTDTINLKLAAGLQESYFTDPDVRVDANGIVSTMRRKDRRERLILELGYKHHNDWLSRLELIYLERKSNFAEFEYDRSVLTLTVGRSFGE